MYITDPYAQNSTHLSRSSAMHWIELYMNLWWSHIYNTHAGFGVYIDIWLLHTMYLHTFTSYSISQQKLNKHVWHLWSGMAMSSDSTLMHLYINLFQTNIETRTSYISFTGFTTPHIIYNDLYSIYASIVGKYISWPCHLLSGIHQEPCGWPGSSRAFVRKKKKKMESFDNHIKRPFVIS